MIVETKKSMKAAQKAAATKAMTDKFDADFNLSDTQKALPADAETKANSGKVKKEFWRTVKFTLFSLSAGIIQFGVGAAFIAGGWNISSPYYAIGYITALVLSVLWNFTFNRKFTFQSVKNVPVAMAWVFLYYAIFAPCSYFWQDAWGKLPGWGEGTGLSIVILAVTILINGVTEFLWQRFFVYRKSIDNNKTAQKSDSIAETNVDGTASDALVPIVDSAKIEIE